MRNYVIINGVNSLTIKGLAINELPPIVKAPMRVLQEEIDGRDGDIITDLGYGAYDKIMTIGLYDGYDINEIIAFFNNEGTIVFSDEADKYYNFKIIEQIDYERLIKFRTASITFHVQPFKYPLTETPVEITNEYVEAEGTSITLTPTAEAPISIDLKGNTYQDSTTGKNKFSTDFKTTDNLTTYTKIDSNSYSFTCSGTWKSAIFVVPCKENTDYFFNYADTSNGTYCYIKGTQTQTDLMGRYHGYFLTFNSGANTTLTITISNGNNSGITSATISNIQLEEGTTTTSFEKYSGGSPSPNPDYPQEIHNVSGDNTIVVGSYLPITKDKWEQGGINSNNGKPTENINRLRSSDYIPITKGEYTVKLNNGFYWVNLIYYDESYNFLYNQNTNTQFSDKTTSDIEILSTNVKYYKAVIKKNPEATITPDDLINATPIIELSSAPAQTQLISLGVEMPSGYTRLDYIESSGTQYIDTGVSPTTQTGIKIQAEATTENNTDKILVGSRVGSNRFWIDFDGGSSKVVWGYGTYASTGTYSLNTKYDIDFNYNGSKKIKINGTSYDITGTYDSTGALSLYIFRANYTSAVAGNFKVYRCQIFEGTTKVRDLIPCKRNSDSEIGMYDIKNNVFYTNAGTGTFTYGNELPNGIELNKIGNYQDYFYYTDKWYLHKEIGKVIYNGTESWTYGSNNQILYTSATGYLEEATITCLSNYYTAQENVYSASNVQDKRICFRIFATTPYLYVKDTTYTSGNDFQTWLSTHNLILYYVLSTPTNTEITDSTLISQLEAIKNMNSYNGTTNISQENNDEPFIIKAKAMKQGSGTATITNSGNIYSKPTIDIEGTGIVDVYIGANQIFSVNVDEEVIIDSTNLEAYKPDGTLANRNVTGNIANLKLLTGNSTIKVDGDIDKATITNYTRWL